MSKEDFVEMIARSVRTPRPPPPFELPPAIVVERDPFLDERLTLPSDTWMAKRVDKLKQSNQRILVATIGIAVGLFLGALFALVLRGLL